ncbi:MAG: cupin domain-containing protein [FCB group bacterium]|nr:cupin domain-containing protein [FCB group bacterium]
MKAPIGQKIKDLRLAAELTQSELADRAQLTKGFISQFENDQTSISLDSLVDILEALGLSLGEFFSENGEDDRIAFTPEERVSLPGKGAKIFELLVPGSTNNLMDPILITLEPGESLPAEEAHNGEEFGYVLSGQMVVKFGKKSHHLRKDDCFYFEAFKPHQFMNRGRNKSTIIWVMTPPQM